ncbi:MAG TPA: DUF222 domain-containing protein, partial [Streptosporangiaceae bacterium]
MTEAVNTPGPAAADGPDRPEMLVAPSFAAAGSLSGEDLLALLDSVGVPHSTADLGDDEEAVLADLFSDQPGQPHQPGSLGRDHDGHAAGPAAGQGSTASPAWIGEHLPAGPGLAAVLASGTPGGASDWDLPGMAAGYRRLAGWAQARELAAVAEIAARRAAANPDIGAGEDGRPCRLPPEAAAEVALELRMSQYGASDWTDLGCQLRWRLPATFAALAAGVIDLARARIIAEATGLLSDEHAAAVEQRVLPAAGERTTGQLRLSVRRAVLAVDPEGAEQRRKDTERRAKVSLYPGEEGTATLTGSGLPSVQAAAAMARITAMARALKASGAGGGLDLLRAHVFIGLLLDTLPFIPPPADGPPDNPPPRPGDQPPTDDGPDDQLPEDHRSPPSADDELPADDGLAGDPPPPDDQLPADDGLAGDPPPDDDQLATDAADPAGDPRPADVQLAGDGGAAGGPDDGSRADASADDYLLPDHGPAGHQPPGDQLPADDGPDDDRSPCEGPGLTGRDVDPSGADDLPGWWPDIPCPGDGDAPPDTGDPPEPPLATEPDDNDDDWPQLPSPDWPALPARLPAPGDPAPAPGDAARARAGLLDVLIPWTSLAGDSGEPGVLGRIGPVSSLQARQLLFLATRSPTTQWRVIVTGDDGRALAVGHARPPRHTRPRRTDPDSTGVIGRVTITIRASTLATPANAAAADLGACPRPLRGIAAAVLAAANRATTRARADAERDTRAGGCAHTTASTAYRPPPRTREHVTARDKTCRFGPCGQPAWRTDLDHTIPWHN